MWLDPPKPPLILALRTFLLLTSFLHTCAHAQIIATSGPNFTPPTVPVVIATSVPTSTSSPAGSSVASAVPTTNSTESSTLIMAILIPVGIVFILTLALTGWFFYRRKHRKVDQEYNGFNRHMDVEDVPVMASVPYAKPPPPVPVPLGEKKRTSKWSGKSSTSVNSVKNKKDDTMERFSFDPRENIVPRSASKASVNGKRHTMTSSVSSVHSHTAFNNGSALNKRLLNSSSPSVPDEEEGGSDSSHGKRVSPKHMSNNTFGSNASSSRQQVIKSATQLGGADGFESDDPNVLSSISRRSLAIVESGIHQHRPKSVRFASDERQDKDKQRSSYAGEEVDSVWGNEHTSGMDGTTAPPVRVSHSYTGIPSGSNRDLLDDHGMSWDAIPSSPWTEGGANTRKE